MRYSFLKKLLSCILLLALLLNQGLFIPVALAHHSDTHENGHGNGDNNENNHGNDDNDDEEDDEDNNNNGNSNNGNSGNEVQVTPTPETTPTPTATEEASLNSDDDKDKKDKKDEELQLPVNAPKIIGLSNDTTPTPSKTWNWDSDDPTAEFRYTISKSATETLHGPFKNEKTATQDKGDGIYYMHVQAKGASGAESEVVTVSAVLDTTKPSTPGEPTAHVGSPTSVTTQTWTWEESTDASQISQYLWWTLNSSTSQPSTEIATTSASATTSLTEGSWSFFVKAKDKAGNLSNSIGKLLTVDITKPSGSITTPQNNSVHSAPPEFKVSALDSQGIASVVFQYKEESQNTYVTLSTDTHSPYEASWNDVSLSAGKTYDLQVRITDKAGNTTDVSGVSFTYNPNPPVAGNDTVTTYKNTSLIIPVSQLLSNDSDPDSSDLSISSIKKGSHGTVSLSGENVVFNPNPNYVGLTNFTYTVTDGNLSVTGTVSVTVVPLVENNQVIQTPKVTLKEEKPQIVVSPTILEDTTISVPKSVKNATLDVNNVITTKDKVKSAVLSNNITINSETSVGKIKVDLPQGIEIKGPSDTWTGVINAPTIIDTATVNLKSKDSTKKIEAAAIVEVGFGDVPLTFNKAVRIVIEGQGGKSAGYSRGDTFTPITTVCSEDSQAAGDALADGADCSINVGGDMVIWTKHFTQFVAYTETTISSNTSTTGSNVSSQPTVCSDTKPGSAPKLLSATRDGKNSVTLVWEKAANPVSYYLISYGTASGLMQYATPYIAGVNTTSYTVNGLTSGTTYYFKVRAGNGCTPGEYSNELSVKPDASLIASTENDNQPFLFEKTTIVEGIKGSLTQGVTAAKNIKPSTIEKLRSLGLIGFAIMMALPILISTNYAMYRLRFKRNSI